MNAYAHAHTHTHIYIPTSLYILYISLKYNIIITCRRIQINKTKQNLQSVWFILLKRKIEYLHSENAHLTNGKLKSSLWGSSFRSQNDVLSFRCKPASDGDVTLFDVGRDAGTEFREQRKLIFVWIAMVTEADWHPYTWHIW